MKPETAVLDTTRKPPASPEYAPREADQVRFDALKQIIEQMPEALKDELQAFGRLLVLVNRGVEGQVSEKFEADAAFLLKEYRDLVQSTTDALKKITESKTAARELAAELGLEASEGSEGGEDEKELQLKAFLATIKETIGALDKAFSASVEKRTATETEAKFAREFASGVVESGLDRGYIAKALASMEETLLPEAIVSDWQNTPEGKTEATEIWDTFKPSSELAMLQAKFEKAKAALSPAQARAAEIDINARLHVEQSNFVRHGLLRAALDSLTLEELKEQLGTVDRKDLEPALADAIGKDAFDVQKMEDKVIEQLPAGLQDELIRRLTDQEIWDGPIFSAQFPSVIRLASGKSVNVVSSLFLRQMYVAREASLLRNADQNSGKPFDDHFKLTRPDVAVRRTQIERTVNETEQRDSAAFNAVYRYRVVLAETADKVFTWSDPSTAEARFEISTGRERAIRQSFDEAIRQLTRASEDFEKIVERLEAYDSAVPKRSLFGLGDTIKQYELDGKMIPADEFRTQHRVLQVKRNEFCSKLADEIKRKFLSSLSAGKIRLDEQFKQTRLALIKLKDEGGSKEMKETHTQSQLDVVLKNVFAEAQTQLERKNRISNEELAKTRQGLERMLELAAAFQKKVELLTTDNLGARAPLAEVQQALRLFESES